MIPSEQEIDMTPIAQAVEPLRVAAQDRAMQFAAQRLDKLLAALGAVDWDLNKVAPIPKTNISRAEYRQRAEERVLLLRVTTPAWVRRRLGEPDKREVSVEAVARYLKSEREACSVAYDAFIAKLEQKIGECSAASLEGDHVWGYSVLSVETPAGAQRWKTQQIVNISSLGKVFNQWPTTKMR